MSQHRFTKTMKIAKQLVHEHSNTQNMKKWLLLSLGFSSLCFSQITIPKTSLPASGDTLRVATAAVDQAMDYTSTGANYVWDFSNLEFNGQRLNEYKPISQAGSLIQFSFGTFTAPKYQASYFVSANINAFNNLPAQLPITIEDICQMNRVVTDSMTQVGYKMTINGQEVPAKSDTIETKYRLPIAYGNTHTSRGYTKLDLNPIYDGIWIQHRKRVTEVDGWGEITTPYGSFPVLRIHHTITESDSFYVSFNGFNFWLPIPVPLSHEYEWRAIGEKEPILLVKTSVTQGAENITAVEYKSNYVAGIEEHKIQLALYPNPVQDILYMESETIFNRFNILTTDGKVIESGKMEQVNQSFVDVSKLDSGVYLIQLESDSGIITKTFVK